MTLPPARSRYIDWLATALDRSVVTPSGDVSGHAVLGYATGYDAADIAPFVQSLRSVFDGVVALVVDDRAEVLQFLADHRVTAIRPDQVEGWSPHPVMQRFAVFDRLLNQWPGVDRVLITDVRDVIFQADPFDPMPEGLLAFQEYETCALGDHAFNVKYIRALVGDAIARTIAHKPCLCVGTVMGPRSEMARLCRSILMLAATPRSAVGGAFGADQAAFNLAIHLDLIEAEIVPNYGRVATLGMTPSLSLAFEHGKVVNPDRTTSAIVHQYDRHPDLAAAVHARWGCGLEHRARVRPKTAGDRFGKIRQSLIRRIPESR